MKPSLHPLKSGYSWRTHVTPPKDPGSPCQMIGVYTHRNKTRPVVRFHETILSFGEPGSLGTPYVITGSLVHWLRPEPCSEWTVSRRLGARFTVVCFIVLFSYTLSTVHVSNEKNPGWLGYMGDYTTLVGGFFSWLTCYCLLNFYHTAKLLRHSKQPSFFGGGQIG